MADDSKEENLEGRPGFLPNMEKTEERESSLQDFETKNSSEKPAPKEASEQMLKKQLEELKKLKMQTGSQPVADRTKTEEDENTINKLIKLAKTKGVSFVVKYAKKQKVDDYILDRLHDELAKDGFFKNLKP